MSVATIEAPAVNTTVEVPSDALRQLANVALFADSTRGATLGVVRLECDGVKITAVATNRYVLGVETIALNEPAEPFTVSLDVAALRPALKLTTNGYSAPLRITVGLGSVVFDNGEGLARVPTSPPDFPKWERLFPNGDTSDHEPLPVTFGVAPRLLAILAKVTAETKDAPVRLTVHTPLKPCVAEIGDTFRALIMPVRLPS